MSPYIDSPTGTVVSLEIHQEDERQQQARERLEKLNNLENQIRALPNPETNVLTGERHTVAILRTPISCSHPAIHGIRGSK